MRRIPNMICTRCNCKVNIEDYEAFSKWQRRLLHVCKATCPKCNSWFGFNQDDVDGEGFSDSEWEHDKERIAVALENVSHGQFRIDRRKPDEPSISDIEEWIDEGNREIYGG